MAVNRYEFVVRLPHDPAGVVRPKVFWKPVGHYEAHGSFTPEDLWSFLRDASEYTKSLPFANALNQANTTATQREQAEAVRRASFIRQRLDLLAKDLKVNYDEQSKLHDEHAALCDSYGTEFIYGKLRSDF